MLLQHLFTLLTEHKVVTPEQKKRLTNIQTKPTSNKTAQ